MNQEFLEYYNRELKILYERSKEFAEEYPGVAERLGGLVEDRMDPGIAGLLEGCAFMAARVQLKLKSEFSEFTTALLDQLLPNYLAPIPSAALVQALPPYEDPNLAQGMRFERGSYVDAVYVEQERRVACRYRLRADLAIWPLHLEVAEYFSAQAPLQALGLETVSGTAAGLRLGFRRLTGQPRTGKDDPPPGDAPVKDLPLDELTVHLVGTTSDAIALYEQLFSNCRRITIRYLDAHGDPKFIPAPPEFVDQIGFGQHETLFERDERVFAGFDLLRDFFVFPGKFLGFRLQHLRKILAQIEAPAFDILFEFDASVARLGSVTTPEAFALYASPASNLFEMTCSRVPIRTGEHEHHIVPDSSRVLDFEAHRVIDVFAHYPGRKDKERIFPLYSLPTGNIPATDALFYTIRRVPRRQTAQERRSGQQSSYTGTELFLSLYEPAEIDDKDRVREVSVRCLASNRHLTEQLPTGEVGADFFLVDDTSVGLRCLAGPTPPRESLVHIERKQRDLTPSGTTIWKIINFLSLNHLGLISRSERDRAGALRELLAIFANISEAVTEKRIRGIHDVSTRPIVRRLKQENGFNAARGIEITVHFDEKAFEGSGVMLLGAVLDRFFAEYASLNSFTETVIESKQRGVIKRWPPRTGAGRQL